MSGAEGMPTRVVTKGSVWLLDDVNGRYCRMPKVEGPRPAPEGEDWGGPGAGPVQDLVWHPMVGWEIEPHWETQRLVITLPPEARDGKGGYVTAPNAEVAR